MNFNNDQCLTINKAIIELTFSSSGLFHAQIWPHGGNRLDGNAIVFYEKDRLVLLSHHNMLLYVIAHNRDIELRRAMVVLCFLLNIMPLSTHEMVEIP